eukprot:m.10942 g.10942  ORF g.10942 m.10942 type:complete len:329 (-) comp8560_c0_seq2:103-1089(-)
MPQTFLAVQCFNCETFQVQQSKKSNKWICVICTSKQSVRKVYGQGTGKQCRGLVQTLNVARHAVDNPAVEDNDGCSHHHNYNDNDTHNDNNVHYNHFEEDHNGDICKTNSDNLAWANGLDEPYNDYSGDHDVDNEACVIPYNYDEEANEQCESSNSQTWNTSNNNNHTTVGHTHRTPNLPNSSHDHDLESSFTKVDKWNVFLPEQVHVMESPTFEHDKQYTTTVPSITNQRKKPVNKRRQNPKNTSDNRPTKRSNIGSTRHTAIDTEIIDNAIQNEVFSQSPTRNRDVEVINRTHGSTKKQRQNSDISNPSPQVLSKPKGKWEMFLSS